VARTEGGEKRRKRIKPEQLASAEPTAKVITDKDGRGSERLVEQPN